MLTKDDGHLFSFIYFFFGATSALLASIIDLICLVKAASIFNDGFLPSISTVVLFYVIATGASFKISSYLI